MITRELLGKLLEGRCSPEELDMLRAYFSEGDADELDEILEQDWRLAEGEAPDHFTENYRERILGRLRKELEPRTAGKNKKVSWKWMAAAVVSLCILAAGGFMLWNKSSSAGAEMTAGAVFTEQKNEKDKPEVIFLPDGSRVVLEPGSMLEYPSFFEEGKRSVQLSGKAFFEVVTDSLRPFFVKTNSLNVRVLGTSFSVSSFENKSAEVSVVTGRVSVFLTEEKEGLILAPNERAVCLEESLTLQKTLVEEPVMVRREELLNLFDFDEAPVSRVFEALEKAYDIKIRFDPAVVERCTLRARLDDQPLFVKLNMICTSLGLEYEIAGTDILITGEGC